MVCWIVSIKRYHIHYLLTSSDAWTRLPSNHHTNGYYFNRKWPFKNSIVGHCNSSKYSRLQFNPSEFLTTICRRISPPKKKHTNTCSDPKKTGKKQRRLAILWKILCPLWPPLSSPLPLVELPRPGGLLENQCGGETPWQKKTIRLNWGFRETQKKTITT